MVGRRCALQGLLAAYLLAPSLLSPVEAQTDPEALAQQAGLSVRAISDLERGLKSRPHLETVRLLADALSLSQPERATFTVASQS